MSTVTEIKNCRLCKAQNLNVIWNLAPSPYGDLFCKSSEEAKSLPKIDLTLLMCSECNFIQLGQNVDIDEIYKNYIYTSSTTSGLAQFYNRLCPDLISKFDLKNSDLIIDIGSNDGTALLPFLNRGFKVLGVEPASKPASKSVSSGIETINKYLDAQTVEQILTRFGKAKLVTANFVSANVPNPVLFFEQLKSLITENGIISIITGYHPDQFSLNMFEYINHDHLSYFSLDTALILADIVGLKLISAQKIELKGGSIQLLFSSKKNKLDIDETINQIHQREYLMRIQTIDYYENLKSRVSIQKSIAQNLLPNSNLIGIGGSISTTHLLHEFEIGDRFNFLLDDSKSKIKKFSPGFGLPVYSFAELKLDLNSKIVILAWQHTNIILKKIQNLGYTKNIFLLLPTFREVK